MFWGEMDVPFRNCMAYSAWVMPGKIVMWERTDFVADVTAGMVVADRSALTYEYFRANKRKCKIWFYHK